MGEKIKTKRRLKMKKVWSVALSFLMKIRTYDGIIEVSNSPTMRQHLGLWQPTIRELIAREVYH